MAMLAAVTLGFAAAYTLWLNPEVRFYKHAAEVKLAWAARLDREVGKKTIVCGGSSTAFSVDGERLLEKHHLPVANFGLHAGMEPLFLAAFAAKAARAGDTLVLAFEPGLLMVPFGSTDLAAQMGFALRAPELIHASNLNGEPIHWVQDLLSLRPGAYHAFTLLGKIILRKPLYRYSPRDVQPSGWQKAGDFRPIPEAGVDGARLCADAHRLLDQLRRWGETNHVQVVYSLPWGYVGPKRVHAFQQTNLRFIREVAQYLPVLKDPCLGAYPVREHYADTPWHLTAEGAALRSDSLAAQIKEARLWTDAELDQLARNKW